MAKDKDTDPNLLVSTDDIKAAALRIRGVVDAYVLSGFGTVTITAIVKGRDLDEVRAILEKRFRRDFPITMSHTIEVLEGET